jgi:hypothetical protein
MENSLIELHPVYAHLIPAQDPNLPKCMIHDSLLSAILEDEAAQAKLAAEQQTAAEMAKFEGEFFECYELIDEMLNVDSAPPSPSSSSSPSSPPHLIKLRPAETPLPISPLTLTRPALDLESEDDYCTSGSEWESCDDSSSDGSPTRRASLLVLPLRPAPLRPSNPITTLLAPHLTPCPTKPALTSPTPSGTTRPKPKRGVSFSPLHETRTYGPNTKVHILSSPTSTPIYTDNPTGPISLARRQSSSDKQILILGWSLLDSFSSSASGADSEESELEAKEIQKSKSSRRPCICVSRYCRRLREINPDGDIEVDFFGGLDHTSLQERYDGCSRTIERLQSRFITEIDSSSSPARPEELPSVAPAAQSAATKALSLASTYVTHTLTRLHEYISLINASNTDKPARLLSCPDDMDIEFFEGAVEMVRDRLEELMLSVAEGKVDERETEEDVERVIERLKGLEWVGRC